MYNMIRIHNVVKTGHRSIGRVLPVILRGSCLDSSNSSKLFTNRFLSTTTTQSRLHNQIHVFEFRITRCLLSTCNQGTNTPIINVEPHGQLLVDEDLHIKVRGLNASQKVSVYAYLSEENQHFESSGCYIADDNGDVSLKDHASSCGTYTGISSMGLFWSMVPCPGQREGTRLMKRSVETPLCTSLTVYDGHQDVSELRERSRDTAALCTTSIDRWYMGSGVKRVEITDGKLRGTYFIPPGPGPFPSVIDLYGTPGGLAEHRASLLASRGVASLALAYFRYKDLPHNLWDINLDYFLEAVDWLLRESGNEQIGVVGLSKGGELGLLLASQTPKVSAVVNINGCAFYSVEPLGYSREDIPFVRCDNDKLIRRDGKVIMNESYNYTEKDVIPAWKGEANILNILGEDDMCCPTQSINLLKNMYPADKAHKFLMTSYPGAGHVIEPPYGILCNVGYHRVFDMLMVYGGSTVQHAHAQEDMWRKTINFLHEELRIET